MKSGCRILPGAWVRRRVAEPDFGVVVVGFGPVGTLLANLLGQYGLGVLVLERDADIHRAIDELVSRLR